MSTSVSGKRPGARKGEITMEEETTLSDHHQVDSNSFSKSYGAETSATASGTMASAAHVTTIYNATGSTFPSSGRSLDRSGSKKSPSPALSSVRRKVIFACLGLNSVLVMICIAIMVPFFPQVAASKDPSGKQTVAGATAIGFVFSISPLTEFLAAPLVARIIPHSGPKTVLVMGGVLVGCTLVLFGFVQRIDDWSTFLALCYALRAVQGVGTAFNVTTTFAVLVGIFPNHVSLVSGTIRSFNSLGFTIGPAMSGALYEYRGFTLPFVFYGGLMLAGTVAIAFSLPADEASPPNSGGAKGMVKATLLVPWSLTWLICVFLTGLAMGMLEPNVSPFLEDEFHLSPSQVGLVYLLYAGVLAIASPIIGVVTDRWVGPQKFLAPSMLLIGVGFALIGPWTVLTWRPALWRTMLALVLVALGAATCVTCTTPGVLSGMHSAGYTDSLELHSHLGGIVTAFFAAGIAFGPTLGSTAVGALGFQDATALYGAVMAFACLAGLAVGIWQHCKCSQNSYAIERQALLSASPKHSQSSKA